MKKVFLLTLMVAASVAGNAQFKAAVMQQKANTPKPMAVKSSSLQKVDNSVLKMTTAMPATKKAVTATPFAPKATRRVLDNGVYYDRPAGTYFLGWTDDWGYYYSWFLFGAPIEDNLYVNRCTPPEEAFWTLEKSQQTYDLSDEVDKDNNLPWGDLTYNAASDTDEEGNTGYLGFSRYYLPTINLGESSYILGEDNVDEKGTNYGALMSIAGRPQRFVKKLCNGAYSYWNDGNGGYGGDIYGTNSYLDVDFDEDGTDEQYRIVSLFQYHEKPILPLYVENVVLTGRPNAETGAPAKITEEHPLVMSFYNVVTDEEGRRSRGDSLMHQITCTQANVIPVEDNGQVFGYNFVFANRTVDFFGMEIEEPFVLDQAYCIVVSGFADEGNEVVIAADKLEETDDMYSDVGTGMMMVDANGEPAPGYRVYRNVTLTPQFNAMFDCAKVYDKIMGSSGTEYTDLNIITVPVEGGNTFEITSEDDDVNLVAYVQTLFDWFDENDSENYFIEDLPDWVSDFFVDETMRERQKAGEEIQPLTFVGFEVDPLPEGVEGRYAYVHITSLKGAYSQPIIIKQGEVELPSGIQAAKTTTAKNGAIYSLTGQRVSKASKGLYIKNGKKYINK